MAMNLDFSKGLKRLGKGAKLSSKSFKAKRGR